MTVHLPPYQPRPDETLPEKCARLRRELQSVARPARPAANDNAVEADPDENGVYWWHRD